MQHQTNFKNRKKIRLPDYNYSSCGGYFVTICTKNKRYLFGDIIDGCIELSKIGIIIKDCWLNIPKHFEEVLLDEYVIMPNHIHGIIFIHKGIQEDSGEKRSAQRLFNLIGSFKSVCTKFVNKNISGNNFMWQKSFYEHVIRNDQDLYKIQEYIVNNPLQWEIDELNINVGNRHACSLRKNDELNINVGNRHACSLRKFEKNEKNNHTTNK